MRYCRADAFFVIQEINIGLAADVGTLQRLPKLIPSGLMRELAYTGRRIFAEEAKASGLVNAVFEDQETLLSEVRRIARGIAEKSPLAIHSSKEIMNYARDHTLEDAPALPSGMDGCPHPGRGAGRGLPGSEGWGSSELQGSFSP